MNNIDRVRGFLIIVSICVVLFLIIQVSKKMSKQGFTNLNSENKSMFLFANNKSDPSCCNFSYSTSNGCVCITNEQQQLLHTRGGNRTIDADF
jgi:hypothetical protein